MRVDLVAEQLCSRIPGGTGRYSAQLLRTLPGTGLEVRAVVGRACAAIDELAVTNVCLGIPGPGLARLWERGLPPLVGAGADLVHAPTLLLPPVRRGTRLVVTIHDVVPWTHPDTLTPRGAAFHRRMGERASRKADLILTPTEHVAQQVRSILRPRAEVRPVPLGVTPLPVPHDVEVTIAAHGLGSRPYVLFVGTREPRKGLDVLIRAMRARALAEVDLAVVGAMGWGEVDLDKMARAAGLGLRLHALGALPDDELAALYAGAAVVALPSRAEGFGIPVIEAMALGAPVVTSDDPALVETGAGWAWTSPVGDEHALAETLAMVVSRGPDVLRRIDGGRVHAAELTWATAARRTAEAYAATLTRS